MTSNVYHVHFTDHQLPESGEEKARFAREYSENLTGETAGEISVFIQQSAHDPTHRVTISVPQRLEEAVRRIEASGLSPAFTEPEAPRVDGDSCIIPGSFQIRHFGTILDPRSISNHPQRQSIIAETLAENVPDFPEHARDFLNWETLDSDDETGTAVLYWKPEPEEPQAGTGNPRV